MAKFAIEYKETYSAQYIVEADSFEEACDKLTDAIQNDKVDAPEYCEYSTFIDNTGDYTEEEIEKAFSPGLHLNPSKSIGLNFILLIDSHSFKNSKVLTFLSQLEITEFGSSSFLTASNSIRLNLYSLHH